MIIDSHAHVFPFLGAPAGYPSANDHLLWLQFYVSSHKQPVRRLRDHSLVTDRGLAHDIIATPSDLLEVGFRIEDNGRFVWTHKGEDLYIHFMPPSLQTNSSSPEYLATEMAYAGVDFAVLQNAHLYGRLNEYFAAACAKYPGRFVGLAEVDEARAGESDQIEHLRTAVLDQGLQGLYYATRGLLFCDYRYRLDDQRFEPLWDEIRRLRIPIFWELQGVPVSDPSSLVEQVRHLNRWADRHPDIQCVYTHGFSPDLLDGIIPVPVLDLLHRDQFLIEILWPISWGRDHAYPYSELERPLRTLLREVGPGRLVWGSDMPNVLRHCTYEQSLEYLRRLLVGIASSEEGAILGGNIARLFPSRLESVQSVV